MLELFVSNIMDLLASWKSVAVQDEIHVCFDKELYNKCQLKVLQ